MVLGQLIKQDVRCFLVLLTEFRFFGYVGEEFRSFYVYFFGLFFSLNVFGGVGAVPINPGVVWELNATKGPVASSVQRPLLAALDLDSWGSRARALGHNIVPCDP